MLKQYLKWSYIIPPKRIFPQFLIEKKVPRDPGSRDRGFFALCMGLFFFFMSISGIFSIIIDNTFLSKLDFFSVSRRNYVFCPQYILTSKFLQGSGLVVIISVFFH